MQLPSEHGSSCKATELGGGLKGREEKQSTAGRGGGGVETGCLHVRRRTERTQEEEAGKGQLGWGGGLQYPGCGAIVSWMVVCWAGVKGCKHEWGASTSVA